MSIESHPGRRVLAPPAPVSWGEIAPQGQVAQVIRFELSDRMVTFPTCAVRRWEHAFGENEILTISVAQEEIVIEGQGLGLLRNALDLGRLCAVRPNFKSGSARPGPRVARIVIEAA